MAIDQAARRCLSAALALVAALLSLPAARAERVELELVLAVDVSSSVDREEFELQMQGLASAFRDAEVLAALRMTAGRGIAVTLIQWSRPDRQRVGVPWTWVGDRASAAALAARLAAMPRYVTGGGTAIGSALRSALGQFQGNGYEGQRRIIDVSGDGLANVGVPPERVRDVAVAAGVTINALAILNEEWRLDRYYRERVIGGAGAFVMTARNYVDFARAIVAKLVREIGGAPVARRHAPSGARPAAWAPPPRCPVAARCHPGNLIRSHDRSPGIVGWYRRIVSGGDGPLPAVASEPAARWRVQGDTPWPGRIETRPSKGLAAEPSGKPSVCSTMRRH